VHLALTARFHHLMLLTVILVRGIKESREPTTSWYFLK